MSEFETPVALRCWPVYPEGVVRQPSPTTEGGRRRRRWNVGRSTRIGQRVLVFDTETTVDEFQSLRFGFFRLYEEGELLAEGALMADELPDTDPAGEACIRAYCEEHGLFCETRESFVREWLYKEAWQLGTLVVGFNLPFDLSRIAMHAGVGRGRHRDAFSFKLSPSLFHPRLRIKALSAHAAMFEFTKAKRSERGERREFTGRFLDLHTVAYALSGKGYSLRAAGEAFGADERKSPLVEHEDELGHGGPITAEYLEYARQDVAATYSLYLALLQVYAALPFATSAPERDQRREDTPITGLYSPASLAKAFLRKMGVQPFLAKQPDFPPEYLGYAMAAFYAGRTEVRIRKVSVPATIVDFTSQYPAVFTLLDLWPWVTAEKLHVDENCRGDVHSLLISIAADPDRLFDPMLWPQLAGYAQVLPEGDILPVRVPWGAGAKGNLSNVALSVCPLRSNEPMWYALPDLAASVALTGKVPYLKGAFRIIPEGREKRLRTVRLGEAKLNPRDPRFFATIVGEKERLKAEGETALSWGTKMLANAGCYGIFAEFNPRMLNTAETSTETTLFSEGITTTKLKGKVDVPGPFTNPLVASLVTSGGRLLLALLQREVEHRCGAFVWTATDAMALVTGDGGTVPSLPGGRRSLTPGEVTAIQDRFQPLTPDAIHVPAFLKREESGLAYAIAANRYCLRREDGTFLKVSLHGLSGIISPDGGRLSAFGEGLWRAALTDDEPVEWEFQPLRRRVPVRQPAVWNAVQPLRSGREYVRSIRPFSFIQMVSRTKAPLMNESPDSGAVAYGPYRRDTRQSLRLKWWQPHSPEPLKLTVRPSSGMLATSAGDFHCGSLTDFFGEFITHPEVKMADAEGACQAFTSGLLQPRAVLRNACYRIGKEVDRLDETSTVTSKIEGTATPLHECQSSGVLHPLLSAAICLLEWRSPLAVADELGISERHWFRIRVGASKVRCDLARRILTVARINQGSA